MTSEHPLGRHPDAAAHHDPRSRRFALTVTASPTDCKWDRPVPILDQGSLGSCTGNALVGVLGTNPVYPTLAPAQQSQLGEPLAVAFYSDATHLDDYDGTFPPTDTGSDGLSAMWADVGPWARSRARWHSALPAAQTGRRLLAWAREVGLEPPP